MSLDRVRIGILGTSLGSCLALLTATHEPLIRAQAQNVFDAWKWGFRGTQLQIQPNPQRKLTLQLTLDY